MTEVVLAVVFIFVVLPAIIVFEEWARRRRERKAFLKRYYAVQDRDGYPEKEWF